MAKKKPFNFGKNAIEKRRAVHTRESLGEQLRKIREAAAEMEAAIDVMKTMNIDEIDVDGAAKFENGMKSVVEYLARVRMGVARISLGPRPKKK